MSATVTEISTTETPCTKVCRIDRASRLCAGCLRSLDEIAEWGRMSPDARRRVMAKLSERRIG